MEYSILNQTIETFFNSWWVYLIFGMLFGSFLNVVIYRIPKGLSIVSPPSACPICKSQIKWYDNIPVLSWIFLRGKCRVCKTNISIQYPIVELSVALLTLFLYFKIGASFYLFFMILLSYILFSVAIIDFKTYTIPTKMQISLLILAIIGVVSNFFHKGIISVDWVNSILGMVSGFLLLYIIGLIGRIVYKRDDAMGGGDIILFTISGLILGWQNILLAFFIASFIAVLAYIIPTIINMINRKKEVLGFLAKSEKMKDIGILISLDGKLNNLGIILQIKYSLKSKDYTPFLSTLKNEIEKNMDELEEITILRLSFRFIAVDENKFAIEMIKKMQIDKFGNIAKKVINEDLIGYNYATENFNLLKKELQNNGLSSFVTILNEKNQFIENNKILNLKELKEDYNSINPEQKIDFLLKYNRIYQYNGYTEEQEYVAKELLNIVETTNEYNKSKILSDMAFVYYSDRFYVQYKEITGMLNSIKQNELSINLYLKLSLFRTVFFKQGLAFGPYLAAGILISELYGNQIIDLYMKQVGLLTNTN